DDTSEWARLRPRPRHSHEPVDQVLVVFLLAGARLWIDVLLFDARGDLLEAALAREHRLGFFLLPAGVTGLDGALIGAVLEDRGGGLEATGENIEAADMAVHQIDGVERLAADLGV